MRVGGWRSSGGGRGRECRADVRTNLGIEARDLGFQAVAEFLELVVAVFVDVLFGALVLLLELVDVFEFVLVLARELFLVVNVAVFDLGFVCLMEAPDLAALSLEHDLALVKHPVAVFDVLAEAFDLHLVVKVSLPQL